MPTFKTQAQIESQLAWPIGFPTRAMRDAKFASPRCEAPPDAAAATATLYRTSSTNVAPGDYSPPHKNLGLQILPMDKPCLRHSSYLAAYPAPDSLHARLRALRQGALAEAFARLDAGSEGFVLLSELRMLLVDAFAASGLGEPEEALVATLTNLFEREGARRSDGAVLLPLVHVEQGCAAVADMLAEEAALGRPEVVAQASSLMVKEARARDRGVDTAPSLEGPPRPRLPPTSPLPSPHATMRSLSAVAAASPKSPFPSAAQAAAMRESLRRTAPPGDTLALDGATGLLVEVGEGGGSSSSGGGRLLTAGALGSMAASPRSTGMNLGALRQAQLTGEAKLGGREPPAAHTGHFRLAGPSLQTSLGRDYGDFGSAPVEREVVEPGIAGFAQTCKELAAGSTRMSKHVPYYTGHVPKDPHGASAEFGLGAVQRNSFHRSTNLIDNFKSRVSGYTGYLPRHAMNQTVDVDKVRGVEANSEYDHNVAPVAATTADVSPRIIPMQPRALADHLTRSMLKMREWEADAGEDPAATAAVAASSSSSSSESPGLQHARMDTSGLPTVPADLAEEARELMGGGGEAGAAAGAAAAPSGAIAMPENVLPASSLAQALARGGGMGLATRRTSAMVREVESMEVVVLGGPGTRLPLRKVYKIVLQRLQAISPPGHYAGLLGAARRSRLWWKVYGLTVGACIVGVVLGAGVLALCVFCPIAGIIVVANVLLISGAAGAASSQQQAAP